MRSLRLDDELDADVRRAAAREGATVSEFLRRAAAERAQRTLAEQPSARLHGIIGAVHSRGGQARNSGDRFGELLTDRRKHS